MYLKMKCFQESKKGGGCAVIGFWSEIFVTQRQIGRVYHRTRPRVLNDDIPQLILFQSCILI